MSILPPRNSYSSFLLSFFTRLCNPCLSHNAIDLDLDLKQEKEEKEEKMPGLVANSEAAVNPPSTAHVAATKPTPPPGKTFAYQDRLPHLPIPPLEDTCKRYLKALEALQDEYEHEETKKAVKDFLENDGPRIQQKLIEWGKRKDSYIEDFWYESYLSHSDPVVLALNPFFVLENDPTPSRGTQIPRAAALITSSLGFVHDLQAGLLEPDNVRGVPLCMDQYSRLFGTARVPTSRGCKMEAHAGSRHIVVLRRGQFYWFDVLDDENRPLLTEREISRNLNAILADADKVDPSQAARNSIGVLTTENRKIWSGLREMLQEDRSNKACLDLVDHALFIAGEQVGTCTNRWYDKLQIIVCADGTTGINFEHTGVDGHTVLRYAADVFTDGLMLMARSINPSAPTMFHAKLSPHAKSYKPPRGSNGVSAPELIDTTPKKLEWKLTPELRAGVRFAETRLSDLICQNDCQALDHGFSPDAFVQMAFQAAYYGLYGCVECPEAVNFTKKATPAQKVAALKRACERHVKLTRECSQGLGQDRHLYALYSLPILSTSNCGNPALRLFGFGPVAADGYGLGYIIKEDGISVCAASKHLQTRRFLDTLQSYLQEIQRILIQLHKAANHRPAHFVDHIGILRDGKTGRPIHGATSDSSSDEEEIVSMPGYGFFDSGEVEKLGRKKKSPFSDIGKVIPLAEY
ncbi:hypothetical protein FA13DRAFT_1756796 [Coprinellus micaceus]|uniref:Choline/carnitine acyltransferase domain-containing protein n=1 Tax=Coprinellus micaceus TaxID=71717 RepID=A0A4Y7SS48_COPMI|nr:hypothetical protein FA13DRAFT_1756796 [Coprinellus micaceus]